MNPSLENHFACNFPENSEECRYVSVCYINNKELERFQVTVDGEIQIRWKTFSGNSLCFINTTNPALQYVNVTTAENTFTVEI